MLLEKIEEGDLQAAQVDLMRQERLRKHPEEQIRLRAKKSLPSESMKIATKFSANIKTFVPLLEIQVEERLFLRNNVAIAIAMRVLERQWDRTWRDFAIAL